MKPIVRHLRFNVRSVFFGASPLNFPWQCQSIFSAVTAVCLLSPTSLAIPFPPLATTGPFHSEREILLTVCFFFLFNRSDGKIPFLPPASPLHRVDMPKYTELLPRA